MMHEVGSPGALVSAAQAAGRLGVSERQLRELIRDGKLPYVNVGLGVRPAYRLRPADLEAFILQRTAICQKLEASTSGGAPANGSTTSKSEVIDFAARRAQRISARPNGGSPRSGRKRRPK
ncbi:helix-turn-helix domain-containing protein [Methylosinus sp.]|uniref:helix-turn-helix domain-containing protein n=1 Tax=Methylosinus sp. TaxID=427 RepID=UPI0039C9B879